MSTRTNKPHRVEPGIHLQANGTFRAFVPEGPGSNKNISAVFATLNDARQWREACAAARAAGDPNPPSGNFGSGVGVTPERRVTVAVLAQMFLAFFNGERKQHLRWRTYQDIISIISRFIEGGPIASRDARSVARQDAWAVRDWLHTEVGLSRERAGTVLKRYAAIFDFGISEGLVSTNPFHELQALGVSGKRPQILERWDLQRTRAFADCMEVYCRLGLFIQRLCGLRAAEMLGLRIRDVIDWQLGILHVQGQGGRPHIVRDGDGNERLVYRVDYTKSRAGVRYVGIPASLLEALRRYVVEVYGLEPTDPNLDGDLPLLVPRTRRPFHQATYSKAYVNARKALQLDTESYRPTGHFMRKQCNTDLLECPGLSHAARCRIIGHEVSEIGMAKVQKHYIIHELDFTAELLAADFMEQKIVAAFGPGSGFVFDEPDPFRPPYASLSISEAAERIGCAVSHVHDLIDREDLPAETVARFSGSDKLWVKESDVEELIARRKNLWTPTRVSNELGPHRKTVLVWCREGEVDAHRNIFGRWFVTEESARKRCRQWRANQHRTDLMLLETAARRLQRPPKAVQTLIEQGVLEEGDPDHLGRQRLTIASVNRVRYGHDPVQPATRVE